MKLSHDELTKLVDLLRALIDDDDSEAFNRFVAFELEQKTDAERFGYVDRLLAISEYSTRLVRNLRSFGAV